MSRAAATSARSTRRRKARPSATTSTIATSLPGATPAKTIRRNCTKSRWNLPTFTPARGATHNETQVAHLAAEESRHQGQVRQLRHERRESGDVDARGPRCFERNAERARRRAGGL